MSGTKRGVDDLYQGPMTRSGARELLKEKLQQAESEGPCAVEEVQRMEEELEKYKAPDRTPMVTNPDSPSKEERERHELTHANHKSWCKHCQRALLPSNIFEGHCCHHTFSSIAASIQPNPRSI